MSGSDVIMGRTKIATRVTIQEIMMYSRIIFRRLSSERSSAAMSVNAHREERHKK